MTTVRGILGDIFDALEADPELRNRVRQVLAPVLDVRAAGATAAAIDDLLPVPEVARRLGVSTRAVRHWLATGALASVELPATSTTGTGCRRIVRVRVSEVARFLQATQRGEPATDPVVDLAVARALRSGRR